MTDDNILCPIPANEAQRLRAVLSYEILDTMPEIDFDILTRVAANALNTPAAVIGLMDRDRLWFKSKIGLDVQQLDRQIAFCAHALMQPDELLIVEDLRADPRFHSNPLVTNPPNLCFYAGAPLIDHQGYTLGTIAVVDVKPRVLTEAQKQMLHDLSSLVISALENRQRSIQLSHLAMTDHLTGLANRAQFERTLNAEMAHSRRTGEPFSVLYMDLDDFKKINDTLGHAAGDEVLCEVARRMSDQLRTEDLLARIGGDEFAVFMRQSSDDSPDSLARRITDVATAPVMLSDGNRVRIGVSIGITTYRDDMDSSSFLMSQADQALYQAKRKKLSS